MMSGALANQHRATVQRTTRQITGLILALERSITAQTEAIAFLSMIRSDLRDSEMDDSHLVTGLVNSPLLNGNERLSVSEAERIVHTLTDMIERHGTNGNGRVGNV